MNEIKELYVPIECGFGQIGLASVLDPLNIHREIDDHPDFNRCLTESGLNFKPWGYQGWYTWKVYDGSYPLRLGFALINNTKGSEEIGQNYHRHKISGEVLMIYTKGDASIYSLGEKIKLPQKISTWYIPPGIPHDLRVTPGSWIFTVDPKLFLFGQREDRVDPNCNFGSHHNSISRIDGRMITFPPYNLSILVNHNQHSNYLFFNSADLITINPEVLRNKYIELGFDNFHEFLFKYLGESLNETRLPFIQNNYEGFNIFVPKFSII